ncbi:hypothetical protein pb186bvf_008649 [Paramecium bursaria]
MNIRIPTKRRSTKVNIYSQSSIQESPMELENSFVIEKDNVSKIDYSDVSIRVEDVSERLERSQSQIGVRPFLAEQSPSPFTLSIPQKERRQQSFSFNKDSRKNTLEQRRSVRLKRGLSQAKETKIVERSKDESGRKKLNNYIILQELGRGGFGKVKLVYDQQDSTYYAMKIADKGRLKKKLLTKETSAFSLLEQEIAILKKIDHPNIVRLHEVIDDPEERKLYIIMDYVKKGSINSKTYWKSEGKNIDGNNIPKLEIERLRRYIREFLLGLDYCKKFKIQLVHNFARVVHRDIKPDNILVDSEDHVKIADFGVAQMIESTEKDLIQGEIGTKTFLPPEIYKNHQVKGKPADIWATGITLYMIAVGRSPYNAKTLQQLKEQVEGEISYPDDLDPLLVDFLKCALIKDQRQRATLDQLMDHPFVTENGLYPLFEQEFDQRFIISEKDVSKAISKLAIKATVRVTAKLKVKLNQSRQRIKSRTQSQMVEG